MVKNTDTHACSIHYFIFYIYAKREMRVSKFGKKIKIKKGLTTLSLSLSISPVCSLDVVLCGVGVCMEQKFCGETSYVPWRTIMNLLNRLFLFNLCANINVCI